ncbi:hypothetical protein DM828_02080, partial [Pseudomonas umsongensis]|nr:hypothetical protein [Pseudomonas umsongensis]
PVGASLLAKAVGQLASLLDVPPSSRASPLPHFDWWPNLDLGHDKPPVGAGLPAMAVGRSASMLNVPPLRERARAYRC